MKWTTHCKKWSQSKVSTPFNPASTSNQQRSWVPLRPTKAGPTWPWKVYRNVSSNHSSQTYNFKIQVSKYYPQTAKPKVSHPKEKRQSKRTQAPSKTHKSVKTKTKNYLNARYTGLIPANHLKLYNNYPLSSVHHGTIINRSRHSTGVGITKLTKILNS